MNRYLALLAFSLGLLGIGWIGFGYIGSNALALTMTVLIGAFYWMGALELRRFQQATASLARALAAIPENLPVLGDWLATLPASLRNPVRLRIEGERIGLPGPAMTPYLVGLLVLLGMLGTFLGMVVTLNGAVMALESTTDLPTIRAALAAPVKGLGLAFGTSIAGVAASAMLGLLSALCRRDRLQTAQLLDGRMATDLRVFSLAHQRQETLEALRLQARVMPEMAGQWQAMMAQMARQSQDLNAQLLSSQQGFHGSVKAVYSDLAASMDQSLRHSLTESARLAGATIQPAVEATMAGMARETQALQEKMAATVQWQLEGLSLRFGSTVETVTDVWTTALARQERSADALTQGLQHSLQAFTQTFDRRSAALLASVAETHQALQGELAATTSGLAQQTSVLHERMAGTVAAQLDAVAARFGSTAADLSQSWSDAIVRQQGSSDALSREAGSSLAALAQTFEQRSAALLRTVDEAHAGLQLNLAAQDRQRLAAWTESLAAIASSLQQEWRQAGAATLSQQAQICQTLEQTSRDLQLQAELHARQTIAEMAGLMQAAAQAPRAAAELIGGLRQQLSDSLVRDNDLLSERSRIMATLSSLLDAVNQAASEQRAAVDSLVATSAALLQQVGSQFTERVESESAKLSLVAARITGSAVEVSSLGESFGLAVQLFSESNDSLVVHLQRIEGALNKSTARSDEQLAYYVAQAREIIDLSLLSQKQIVEDLQQLASRPTALTGPPA